VTGVGGTHAAGVLLTVKRQHVGAERLVPELLVEASAEITGTTVSPTTGMKPPMNNGIPTRAVKNSTRMLSAIVCGSIFQKDGLTSPGMPPSESSTRFEIAS